MKKILLTLLVLGSGSSLAFAQTSHTDLRNEEDTVYPLVLDGMVNRLDDEVERDISIYDLPETVQEQLKYSELAAHKIVSIVEIEPQVQKEGAPMLYELLLEEPEGEDTLGQRLLVGFDEYGERLYEKEAPPMEPRASTENEATDTKENNTL